MITLRNFAHMSVNGFSNLIIELDNVEFKLTCQEVVQIPESAQLYVYGLAFDCEKRCMRVYVNRGE